MMPYGALTLFGLRFTEIGKYYFQLSHGEQLVGGFVACFRKLSANLFRTINQAGEPVCRRFRGYPGEIEHCKFSFAIYFHVCEICKVGKVMRF